jgi:hypothetical protein
MMRGEGERPSLRHPVLAAPSTGLAEPRPRFTTPVRHRTPRRVRPPAAARATAVGPTTAADMLLLPPAPALAEAVTPTRGAYVTGAMLVEADTLSRDEADALARAQREGFIRMSEEAAALVQQTRVRQQAHAVGLRPAVTPRKGTWGGASAAARVDGAVRDELNLLLGQLSLLQAETSEFRAQTITDTIASIRQSRVRATLGRWQSYAQSKCRLRQLCERIVSRMRNGLLASALLTWRDTVDEKQRLQTLCERIVSRMRNGLLASSLLTWRDTVDEQHRYRVAAMRILRRWQHAELVQCFDVWCGVTLFTLRAEAIARSCGVRSAARCLRAAMQVWVDWADELLEARSGARDQAARHMVTGGAVTARAWAIQQPQQDLGMYSQQQRRELAAQIRLARHDRRQLERMKQLRVGAVVSHLSLRALSSPSDDQTAWPRQQASMGSISPHTFVFGQLGSLGLSLRETTDDRAVITAIHAGTQAEEHAPHLCVGMMLTAVGKQSTAMLSFEESIHAVAAAADTRPLSLSFVQAGIAETMPGKATTGNPEFVQRVASSDSHDLWVQETRCELSLLLPPAAGDGGASSALLLLRHWHVASSSSRPPSSRGVLRSIPLRNVRRVHFGFDSLSLQ